jgi:hypothetical protein
MTRTRQARLLKAVRSTGGNFRRISNAKHSGGWGTPTFRSSGRVRDKVPSSYVGARAAQLNR